MMFLTFGCRLAITPKARFARSRSLGSRIWVTRCNVSGVMRAGTTPATFCSRTQPDSLTISSGVGFGHGGSSSISNEPQRGQLRCNGQLGGSVLNSALFPQISQGAIISHERSSNLTVPPGLLCKGGELGASGRSGQRIDLRRRQGLADRLLPQRHEDRL